MSSADPHPCELSDEQLLEQCSLRRTRGSGPGGQHRNKVQTAIVITHNPSNIIGQASERRSQAENRTVALHRLRINLAVAQRTDRGLDRPSDRWQSRLSGKAINISPRHPEFPALLAEALDFIAARSFDMVSSAEALGCSTSQLTKFCKNEPAALVWVNRQRKARNLKAIK